MEQELQQSQYSNIRESRNIDALLQLKLPSELRNLSSEEIQLKLQLGLERRSVYFFTMRDARRITANTLPTGIHIFDYVDPLSMRQEESESHQLYLDGENIESAPCQEYSLTCYKEKLIQVFETALNTTRSDYLFYMESDNELCLPLERISEIALRYRRYFISGGVGASGWVMSREFMQDFITQYQAETAGLGPDVMAASMLIESRKWSVVRRYWVSHTLLNGIGSKGLTVNFGEEKQAKHLPRCLEPHRGIWPSTNGSKIDKFSWDYFDFDDCPHSEVYPCKQLPPTPAPTLSPTSNPHMATGDRGIKAYPNWIAKNHQTRDLDEAAAIEEPLEIIHSTPLKTTVVIGSATAGLAATGVNNATVTLVERRGEWNATMDKILKT